MWLGPLATVPGSKSWPLFVKHINTLLLTRPSTLLPGSMVLRVDVAGLGQRRGRRLQRRQPCERRCLARYASHAAAGAGAAAVTATTIVASSSAAALNMFPRTSFDRVADRLLKGGVHGVKVFLELDAVHKEAAWA